MSENDWMEYYGSYAEYLAACELEKLKKELESEIGGLVTKQEELQKKMRIVDTALNHAVKMEQAAREASARPGDEAVDILNLVLDELDEECKRIVKALKQTDGKRTPAARIAGVSQSTVSRRIHNVLRPAFAKAGKVLPRYLMTPKELKRCSFDANAPGADDGNKRTRKRGAIE